MRTAILIGSIFIGLSIGPASGGMLFFATFFVIFCIALDIIEIKALVNET